MAFFEVQVGVSEMIFFILSIQNIIQMILGEKNYEIFFSRFICFPSRKKLLKKFEHMFQNDSTRKKIHIFMLKTKNFTAVGL